MKVKEGVFWDFADSKGVMSPADSISVSSDSNDHGGCTTFALSATAMTATLIVPIPIDGEAGEFDSLGLLGGRTGSDTRDRQVVK